MSITAEKRALRTQLRTRLEGMSPKEREQSDNALFERFAALPAVRNSERLLLFWGIPGREPDTSRLLRTLWSLGKETALPRMLPDHGMEFRLYAPDRPLVRTGLGIWEPGEDSPAVSKDWGQVILVPGAAFDRAGFRLGFGGGYYDRWLPGSAGLRVGLCREIVFQEKLPREAHDCRVDVVLTEKGEAGSLPLLP